MNYKYKTKYKIRKNRHETRRILLIFRLLKSQLYLVVTKFVQ